ncbi:hypothetical protein RND71_035284 [Anisodus tanguticus]|uniref:Thioredoxin domain-containing protein n=1 Tax=Anisodus tanguticus TaxID=243964 RepID=A0AAE1R5B1_9SOLA|nr:hypothetical protein RND71_035284 [Anisodus tanguticus]
MWKHLRSCKKYPHNIDKKQKLLGAHFKDFQFDGQKIKDHLNKGIHDVATKYEVKAMTTFLLLKDGAPIDKLVGANPDEVKKRIGSLLAQYNPIDIA